MRITRARATLAILAVPTATVMAACSSGSTSTPHASASRAASPAAAGSASPSDSATAQAALAAYTAMWGDVQAVGETSNYQDPRLAKHLGGKALVTISENMASDKARGIVELGAPVLHPRVITTAATTASVADCLDDTHWLTYYATTRQLTDNVPGGHRYVTATVTNENGTWKVTTLDTRGEGTC